MQFLKLPAVLLFLSIAVSSKRNILLTNDDGWAVAQIRAQFDALESGKFNVGVFLPLELTPDANGQQVILSAPAENKSGTGSSDAPATSLTEPCEFDTCPVGSPPEGFNASDRECMQRLL